MLAKSEWTKYYRENFKESKKKSLSQLQRSNFIVPIQRKGNHLQ